MIIVFNYGFKTKGRRQMACTQVDSHPHLHVVSNPDPFVCRCMRVCKSTITKAIVEQKLTSVDAITEKTEAGGACTCCHRVLQKMLNEHNGEHDVRVHAQMCAAPVQTP